MDRNVTIELVDNGESLINDNILPLVDRLVLLKKKKIICNIRLYIFRYYIHHSLYKHIPRESEDANYANKYNFS